jgi:putative ABC transport system ATP-binding protein
VLVGGDVDEATSVDDTLGGRDSESPLAPGEQ